MMTLCWLAVTTCLGPSGVQPCVSRVATVTLSANDTPESPPSTTPSATCRFCRRDTKTANEDMTRMLESIRKGMFSRPRGGIYYSCVGRGASLFGPESEELKMIRDALGEFPLVGFFCNGEISHNRLYGYTGVLTLFV